MKESQSETLWNEEIRGGRHCREDKRSKGLDIMTRKDEKESFREIVALEIECG